MTDIRPPSAAMTPLDEEFAAAVIAGLSQAKKSLPCRYFYDARGVTAAFNLNLLTRINRELGADFDLAAFAHEAFFDPDESRIEMRLVSLRAQQVRVLGRGFSFGAQERIHTENSHKYTVEDFEALARRAGWLPFALWRDPQHLFSVHELIAP